MDMFEQRGLKELVYCWMKLLPCKYACINNLKLPINFVAVRFGLVLGGGPFWSGHLYLRHNCGIYSDLATSINLSFTSLISSVTFRLHLQAEAMGLGSCGQMRQSRHWNPEQFNPRFKTLIQLLSPPYYGFLCFPTPGGSLILRRFHFLEQTLKPCEIGNTRTQLRKTRWSTSFQNYFSLKRWFFVVSVIWEVLYKWVSVLQNLLRKVNLFWPFKYFFSVLKSILLNWKSALILLVPYCYGILETSNLNSASRCLHIMKGFTAGKP
jgi:hypothetical protein